MSALVDMLVGMCDAAGQIMTEIIQNSDKDMEKKALLDAYSCLNAEGRKEAIKYIQRLQYVPEYKGQPE